MGIVKCALDLPLATQPNASLSPEVLIEKIESTLPRQLGSSLVVTWRRVVMETMIDALINVRGVGNVICLKRFLVGWPSRRDTSVQRCVVKQKRRLDPGSVRGRRLPTVECNRSRQIRQSHCQLIGHGSAKAETHHADFTPAFGTRLQPSC
jgi:hypothetical protein